MPISDQLADLVAEAETRLSALLPDLDPATAIQLVCVLLDLTDAVAALNPPLEAPCPNPMPA